MGKREDKRAAKYQKAKAGYQAAVKAAEKKQTGSQSSKEEKPEAGK